MVELFGFTPGVLCGRGERLFDALPGKSETQKPMHCNGETLSWLAIRSAMVKRSTYVDFMVPMFGGFGLRDKPYREPTGGFFHPSRGGVISSAL